MRRTISVLTVKLIHLFQSESKILATEHVFAQSGRNPRTAPTLTRNAFSDRGGFSCLEQPAVLLQQTQLVPEDNVAERMIGFAFDH